MILTEDQVQEIINGRIANLFDLYPIENLQPVQVQEEMKDGIARMYSHKGCRAYLENAVKIALKNMAVASTPREIAYYQSRVDVLQQLLAKGQQLFNTTNDAVKKR